MLRQYTQPIPRALPASASLDQIIDVVNDNSSRVASLSAPQATVTIPGFPSLNTNLAFQRPRSFRLVGQKFMGPELDLGSNDELFWMWVRRAQPPALYFCRHEQFNSSAARQVLPVQPEWLIEALGIITFDRTAQIEGPTPVGSGRVEIRTRSFAPTGPISRIVIIDDTRGIVLENHIYDAQGVRLATAMLSKHQHDPATGVKLPRLVEIQLPPANMSFTLELGEVMINQLSAAPEQLFTKPVYSGYTEVDLAQPGGLVPAGPPPAGQGASAQLRAAPNVRYQ
jgi:hypothetical protein